MIDEKIISLYAKGMTTRQISEIIEYIYGFEEYLSGTDRRTRISKHGSCYRKMAEKNIQTS